MSSNKPTLEDVLDYYKVDYLGGRTRNQMQKCPLHEDNQPSCSINLDKQVWKCHSCGEGGDSLSLIMKMEGCDLDGARQLAAANEFAAAVAGGSGEQLPGRYRNHTGRMGVAGSSRLGSREQRRSYTPSWRGGRSEAGS